MESNPFSGIKQITTFIFDVDGVLTDGSVQVTEDGHMLRTMNIKDGFALQLAVKLGYRIAIITGGRSQGVVKRLEGLGIKDIFIGVSHKHPCFEDYLNDNQLSKEETLYMGDDLPDLKVLEACGYSCAPADACAEVLETAKYVAQTAGGKGCVREVIEMVLRVRGDWSNPNNHYW
jgi:3-deoxy-D-manno-octulosonate 8-phosphate phosphatase (KDO 8-P phosphatase)